MKEAGVRGASKLSAEAIGALRRMGEPIRVSGNRPFLLDRAEWAWTVESGFLDVFAVTMENGAPVGSRNHVYRVEEGCICFGIETAKDSPIGYLAVGGPETRMIRVPSADLIKLAHSDAEAAAALAAAIDSWVEGLGARLTEEAHPPKMYAEVLPGQPVTLVGRQSVHRRRGVLWVQIQDGRLLFAGNDDFPIVAAGQVVPVCFPCWWVALGPARLEPLSSEGMLNDGELLQSALHHYHSLVTSGLGALLERRAGQEARRLEARLASDARLTEGACERISRVLSEEKEFVFEPGGGHLLEACRLVGQALGIRIRPPVSSAVGPAAQEQIREIARASRVRIREVFLKGNWWQRDNGHLVAFREDDERPLALIQESSSTYSVHDPSERQAHRRVDARVADTILSRAFQFYRPFPDRVLAARHVLRLGLKGCAPDIRRIAVTAGAIGILSILTPIITGILYDSVIPSGERAQLLQLAAALTASALASSVFQLVQGYAQVRIETRAGAAVQAAIWDRLLKLPVSFFRSYSAGDLANRSLGIIQVQQLISGATSTTLFSLASFSFNAALIFYYCRKLAFWTSLVIVPTMLLSYHFVRLQMRYQRPLYRLMGHIQGMTLQFITGIAKLRVAGAEMRAFAQWAQKFGDQKDLALRARSITGMIVVMSSVVPVIASGLIFWSKSFSTDPDLRSLSTGDFLAFNAALATILTSITTTLLFLFPVLDIWPILERTKPFLETVPEIDPTKTDPGEIRGDVEVSRVSFRYATDSPLILKDVSIEARPGEFIAITGPSGSGKSTLLRLLLGFEDPEAGSILIDGQDLAGLDLQSWRSRIGVVLQTGQLMADSIFRNIVGAAPLTLDDAMEAARMCGLDEDIAAMPMGLHTVVGVNGAGLSGGQRQRILIARAIVKRPRLLLFDEATSALDNRTQAIVSGSLEQLQATRIVIAHRLSTIRRADRIYALVDGTIAESGTYNELVARGGVFATLAQRQLA